MGQPTTTRPTRLAYDGRAPLLRAPEKIRSVFLVTLAAACLPLTCGILFFGWRAAWVAGLSVASCALFERFYFRVTHAPALLGRSHAYLTGVLLALTLPPFTPWWVVVMAAAFAIIVGKAIFGGVGHFLWQPALLGRFAVAVIVPILAGLGAQGDLMPRQWPLLAPQHLLLGDIRYVEPLRPGEIYRGWQRHPLPDQADGWAIRPPTETLRSLTVATVDVEPEFSALAAVKDHVDNRKPTALSQLPPIGDMLGGARPGGIGETCAVVIIIAGLYLIYRNYVKWGLPLCFILAAAGVAAVVPIRVDVGAEQVIYWPILAEGEGLATGFTYVCYQVLSGAILLGAFFLATEMTSRPVLSGAQMLFGAGAGATAMLLKLYTTLPIPTYVAILIWNTLTPTIDMIWRPRVYGQPHFLLLRRRKKHQT